MMTWTPYLGWFRALMIALSSLITYTHSLITSVAASRRVRRLVTEHRPIREMVSFPIKIFWAFLDGKMSKLCRYFLNKDLFQLQSQITWLNDS